MSVLLKICSKFLLFFIICLVIKHSPALALTGVDLNNYLSPFESDCHSVLILTNTYTLLPPKSPVELLTPAHIKPRNLYERCHTTNYTVEELITKKIGFYWRLLSKRRCLAYFFHFNPHQNSLEYWTSLVQNLQNYWTVANFPAFGSEQNSPKHQVLASLTANYAINFAHTAYVNLVGSSKVSTLFGEIFYKRLYFRFLDTKCNTGLRVHISEMFSKVFLHDLEEPDSFYGISCVAAPADPSPIEHGSPIYQLTPSTFYVVNELFSQQNLKSLDFFVNSAKREYCGNFKIEMQSMVGFKPRVLLSRFSDEHQILSQLETTETEEDEEDLRKFMLASILLKGKHNTTVSYYYINKSDPEGSVYNQFDDFVFFPKIRIDFQARQPFGSNQIYYPIESTGFNFIACDRIGIPYSIDAYLKPFQTNLWISFAVFFVLVLPLALYFLVDKEMSTIFIFLSYLIEQTLPIPKKLGSLRTYAILVGHLGLIFVLLTSAYKGIVTTDLLAPVSTYNLITFKDVINLKSSFGRSYDVSVNFQFGQYLFNCLGLIEFLNCIRRESETNEQNFETRIHTLAHVLNHSQSQVAAQLDKRLKLWNQTQWTSLTCAERVFGTSVNKIQENMLRFQSLAAVQWTDMLFYAGKENSFPVDVGIRVENLQFLGKYGIRRLSGIIESGVYGHITREFQKEKLRVLAARLRVTKKYIVHQKLSLNRNIQVLFMGGSVALIIALLSFALEGRDSLLSFIIISTITKQKQIVSWDLFSK